MVTKSTGDLDTGVRVSVLESQVETLVVDISKMEGRIDSNYQTLHHRISEMRDDFHKSIEEKHEKVINKLDDQIRANAAQHSAIAEKMQAFEKWRWMIMGAAAIVGYILAHLKFEKLF